MTRTSRWISLLVLAVMLASATVAVTDREDARASESGHPNVVIIVTDDQAEGTLDAMPVVRRHIKQQGVTLTNGIIPTSSCCPSRSALLSGQYARTTGVYDNVAPYGGWPTFNQSGAESHTIAVGLNDAGYTTGLFGKYLNGLALSADKYGPGYVPPGWDTFQAIIKRGGAPALSAGAYYGYDLVGTGATESFGRQPSDYSTDVVTDKAVEFVNATPATEPLLLYYAPYGAHSPYTPAPRDLGQWHNEALNPAATQLTKDRPAFLPDTLLNPARQQKDLRHQHEALMSVDEGVGQVMDALGPERVANTLFVFLSDNGLQFGEHGFEHKDLPYSGSTDVPMLLRWDDHIVAGSTSATLVTNADLTATVAEAAGVSLESPDGVSFFAENRPTSVVLEATSNPEHPAYCGIRGPRFTYVKYAGHGSELFGHAKDPNELVNKAGVDAMAPTVARLKALAQARCFPTPPDFFWG